MKSMDTLRIVIRNLKRRRGRTILTAIGVTIGTAAIVAMMSLAIGLQETAARSINKFGNLTEIEVYPGFNPDNTKQMPKLDDTAIGQIKSIPGVKAVMPKLRFNGGQAEIEIGRKIGNVEVVGVDTKEAPIFEYRVAEGRYLGNGRNEAVISYSVPDILTEKKKRSRKNKDESRAVDPLPMAGFGDRKTGSLRPNLVAKSATLAINKGTTEGILESREFNIRIVGMLPQAQGWGGGTIYLPLELVKDMNKWAGTAFIKNSGTGRGETEIYESLVVKVPDRKLVENITNQINSMGFSASSTLTMLKEINKIFLVLQLVFGSIGAVSLMVATIGITNTMVMSILERTREIGIMKVLGATIPNIRNLFLLEAGSIGFLGGLAGLIISYFIAGIANLIVRMMAQQATGEIVGDIAVIPFWLSLFALVFATVVGVLAGIYPAMRAARLSPLNAIRQE